MTITRVSPLTSNRPIVELDGSTTHEMRNWAQKLTLRAVIIGNGPPEGVVESVQGSMYMDEDGITLTTLYIKRDNEIAGDRTLGWILV